MRLACLVIVLTAWSVARAQDIEPLGLTAQQIVDAIDHGSDAGALVARAIAAHGAGRPPRAETVYLTSQIQSSWLPAMPGTRFVPMDDKEAEQYIGECGKYLFVRNVHRVGDELMIAVGYGNRCSNSGTDKYFRRGTEGWEDVPTGGGFASAMGHCACR